VGCKPTVVVYHALLVGLGRAGRYEEAVHLYRDQMIDHEDPECRPTRATLSLMCDVCLGRDGAEAALAAAAGDSSFGSTVYFQSAGAVEAKKLYKEAVASGLMEDICPELTLAEVAGNAQTVRADVRNHTRSAAIVALLDLLETAKEKKIEMNELVVMTGGKVRNAGPSRPSKLLLTAQALLDAQGMPSKPLSTLTVQALVIDKPALTAWMDRVETPTTMGSKVHADVEA